MISFENIIKMTQKKLYNALRREYSSETTLFQSGSFILVKGEAPVMLVAHLDTVHTNPVSTICKSNDGIWMAPEGIGGDDRCGVYCLMTVHEKAAVKPWLLFTCDEEKGGIGAHGFVSNVIDKQNKIADELKALKYIIEIDRKGEDDAVYYSCGNDDFEEYITSKGFKTQYGSYSDISTIAPELGIAAVNLSSGYYNAHTKHEYININHLNGTIERVVELVDESTSDEVPAYEYVEVYYKNPYYGGYYKSYYGDKSSSKRDLAPDVSQMRDELLDVYLSWELDEILDVEGEDGLRELYEYEYQTGSVAGDECSAELMQMYQELLQFYTPKYLNDYQMQYGSKAIEELYESVFGKTQLANYGR